MKILLRIVAVLTGLLVLLTVLIVGQLTASGALATLTRSSALGLATLAAWLVTLVIGPFAAVQLWRLHRSGLYATALLSTTAITYYLVGLLFLRNPRAPLGPLVVALLVNGALVALMLSPAAKRACV